MSSNFYYHKAFSIANSEDLEYSVMPGGSFRGGDTLLYGIKHTIVSKISRQDEDTLVVTVTLVPGGDRKTGYIRSESSQGREQLQVVESFADILLHGSYHDLINHKFNFNHEFQNDHGENIIKSQVPNKVE